MHNDFNNDFNNDVLVTKSELEKYDLGEFRMLIASLVGYYFALRCRNGKDITFSKDEVNLLSETFDESILSIVKDKILCKEGNSCG